MQNSILPLMMQEKLVLMGRRELVALLTLSSWCLVMVEGLFLAVPRGCLRFVIVVFPYHTHYFFRCMDCNAKLSAKVLRWKSHHEKCPW